MADHDEKKAPLEHDDRGPQAVFTQPLMITEHPKAYQFDDLAPHSFMRLAIVVASVCGFFILPTLFCSIPALILAGVVSFRVIYYS